MVVRISAVSLTTALLPALAVAAGPTPPLAITTTACPKGVQTQPYSGCRIVAAGGAPPYRFTIDPKQSTLPEGLTLDPATGAVAGAEIGGQGTYVPRIVVTDSAGGAAAAPVSFAIDGSNAFLASIFPANSIFHHRMDAATSGLPVDTSPAAPILKDYLPASIRAYFGAAAYESVPNGIPVYSVPYDQPEVPVTTTQYQSYFTAAPIPWNAPIQATANSTGDRHVLILRRAGGGRPAALYEMFVAEYHDGPWSDASNGLWPDMTTNDLTPPGKGTSDAAGLPYAPLLINADEVIGPGTASAPKGVIRHTIPFVVNYMLNYWVWPATQSAGAGTCTDKAGKVIPPFSQIYQADPPAKCDWSTPAGEIYRLKASVPTPACAARNPQSAIIIEALRNYGIIMIDNGGSGANGGLAGTPDARWDDADLVCLRDLKLADFEPVNVSSLILYPESGGTPLPAVGSGQ